MTGTDGAADILDAAAREAELVVRMGLDLQRALDSRAAAPEQMQSLDLLVQQAEGLRTFLASLCGQLRLQPDRPSLDAAAAAAELGLEAQRLRLLGGEAPADATEAGVMELL